MATNIIKLKDKRQTSKNIHNIYERTNFTYILKNTYKSISIHPPRRKTAKYDSQEKETQRVLKIMK